MKPFIPEIKPCPCGCKKVNVAPFFYGQDSTLDVQEAEQIVRAFEDAARYQYLKAHPMALRVLQYRLKDERDAWVDAQMAKEIE